MKILLVNPPRSPQNSILKYAPETAKRFIHKKLIGPPLGLITVAAALKDHDVKVIDLKGEYDLHPDAPPLPNLVESYIVDYEPDIVGVTFIASEFYYGIEIFEVAKKINKEIICVAGGLHTSLCPEDFNNKSVDFVCPGQSAFIFRDLVNVLESGKDVDSVGGILINDENGFRYSRSELKPCNAAVEGFILPAREHLRPWISTYRVGGNIMPTTYLFTSLGCPYKCTFCSIWPQFGGNFLQRDCESIIDELKTLDEYPIVRFADANTIVNVDFVEKLFNRIEEEGIKKEYIMDIRFDTAVENPWLIEKLARGGLKVVICGFESYKQEELALYHKGSQAIDIEKAIDVFHENGIMLRGNYVVPYDYTEDDFKALSEYASGHRIVYAGYTILTPMPGTVYYNQMKSQIIDNDLRKYNFFNCVLPSKLPLEQFYEETGKLWLIKKGEDVI